MSDERASRVTSRRGEAGAAMIEYVMLLGFMTSLIVFLFALLYPSAGKDIETLVNQWGDKIATEIAGDKISKDNEDAWGQN